MSLTGRQYAALSTALRSALTKARLTELLRVELDRDLDDISTAGNYEEIVFALISRAEQEGWTSQLVEAARQKVPGNALLQNFHQQYQASIQPPAWYQPRNHFETCFIPGRRAFINRKSLRQFIRELEDEQLKVLVIDGAPVSGKSYSSHLISYIAKERKRYKVVRIDLKQDALTDYTPQDLARSLARQMKLDLSGFPERDPHAQVAKWVQELRDWIIGEVNCLEESWCVVIDGFQQTVISNETLDLIKYLAAWADNEMPVLSFVLLGYSDKLPAEENSNIRREDISQIEDIDLKEFFEQLYAEKNVPVNSELVDSAITTVNSRIQIPRSDPRYLPSLAQAVREVAEQLFR